MIQKHLWQVSASLDLTEHVWRHLTTRRPPRAFASLDLAGHTHCTKQKSVFPYARYQLITDILMIKESCIWLDTTKPIHTKTSAVVSDANSKSLWYELIPSMDIDDQRILQSGWTTLHLAYKSWNRIFPNIGFAQENKEL